MTKPTKCINIPFKTKQPFQGYVCGNCGSSCLVVRPKTPEGKYYCIDCKQNVKEKHEGRSMHYKNTKYFETKEEYKKKLTELIEA